jgi:Ca2+-binding RTX toxin-like protein
MSFSKQIIILLKQWEAMKKIIQDSESNFRGQSNRKLLALINGTAVNDRFIASNSNDTFDGKSGWNTVDYSYATSGISVNLGIGQGIGGYALGDAYVNIQEIIGGNHSDLLIGRALTTQFAVTYIGTHTNPTAVGLPDGGFFAIWQCDALDGDNTGICGEKYDVNNFKVISTTIINDNIIGPQGDPKAKLLQDGRVICTWETSFLQDIHAIILNDDFSKNATEFQLNNYTSSNQIYPALTVLADGRVSFLWQSFGQDGNNYGIFGRIVNVDSPQTGPDYQVNTNSIGLQANPAVDALPDGGFVAVWHGNVPTSAFYQISVQRFDANFTKVGAELQISTQTTSDQTFAKVAVCDGIIGVVWKCQDSNALGICGQRLDLNLTKIGGVIFLNSNTDGYQENPDIACIETGGFRVTWQGTSPAYYAIFTAALDSNFSKFGGDLQVSVVTASSQVNPSVTALTHRDSVITWESNNKIYFKVYNYRTSFDGGDGDDNIAVPGFIDILDGGAGTDNITYATSLSSVTIDLSNGRGAVYDKIANFENAQGSNYSDTITGDSGSNILEGLDGNDIIEGKAGADVINGGSGTDTASYQASSAGIIISLTGGNSSGGDAAGDSFISVENIIASNYTDFLEGDAAANNLRGMAGDDVLEGRAGGDVLDGGAGVNDVVSYANSPVSVSVNLLTATYSGGDAEGDIVTNIENIVGSPYADTLTGNNGDNVIDGGPGADTIDGAGGSDTASYATAAASVQVNLDIGRETTQADVLANIENVIGSPFDDTLTGNAQANILNGGRGNDVLISGNGNNLLIGGPGIDRFKITQYLGIITIQDFEINKSEKIDLTQLTTIHNLGDLTISQITNDALISIPSGQQLILSNVASQDLKAQNFIFYPSDPSAVNIATIGTIIGMITGIAGLSLAALRTCKMHEILCFKPQHGAQLDIAMMSNDALSASGEVAVVGGETTVVGEVKTTGE